MSARGPRRVGSLVVLAATVLAGARSAHAEPEPAAATAEAASAEQLAAREDFREASRLAQTNDWAGALARYSVSQSRHPHATTLYNIGYCHERLGDFAAAARDTQAALIFEERFPGRGLSAELRARATAALNELAPKVSRVEIVVRAGDLGLRVDGRSLEELGVDGRRLGFVASDATQRAFSPVRADLWLTLNPGTHLLEWRTEQGTGTRELALIAGSEVRFVLPDAEANPRELAVKPLPPPSPPAAKPAPLAAEPAPSAQSKRPLRTLGITSLATGGAAALAGIVAGLLAADTKRDLDSSCSAAGGCPPNQADRIDRFDTQAGVATVAFASAAVLGGLGVTLLLLDSPSSSPQSAVLELRVASEVTLAGHF